MLLRAVQVSSIFAARDLAKLEDTRDPRAVRAIEYAISKTRDVIDVIERKLDLS